MKSIRSMTSLGLTTLLAVTVLGACSDDNGRTTVTTAPRAPIVLGAGTSSVDLVVSTIYRAALEANGFRVGVRDASDDLAGAEAAITEGRLSVYVDHSRELLEYFTKKSDPGAEPTAKTEEEQVEALRKVLPETISFAAFSNADAQPAIACSVAAVEEHSLSTLTSLAAASGKLRLGAPSEFRTAEPFGVTGLKEAYGIEFASVTTVAEADVPTRIGEGSIDCGPVSQLSTQMASVGLIGMTDDQNKIGVNYITPLTAAALDPAASIVLDRVSSQLTPRNLISVLTKVEVEKKPLQEVVDSFVRVMSLGPDGAGGLRF